MENIRVIPTTTAEHIGKKLSQKQGLEVIFPEKNKEGERYFPDGEVYTRIPTIEKLTGRAVVLHSGAPDGLVELEMILEILQQSNVSSVEVFFLYFPYGKQDNIFQTGETNAAENLVRKLRDYYDVNKFYTIDAHFAGRKWVNKYPLTNVSAAGLLTQIALKYYPGATILSPDLGAQRRTGIKLRGLKKKRIDSHLTQFKRYKEFRSIVNGRVVAVLDDMIETGATLVPFYNECMKCGAKEVIALITHGVLSEGVKKIEKKYSKLYLTNTIDREEANVDISDLVFETITENK